MEAPLLALEPAESYVAGAYLAFAALLLIYVGIMAAKLARIQRELRELADAAGGVPPSPKRKAGRASRAQRREMEAARREAQR